MHIFCSWEIIIEILESRVVDHELVVVIGVSALEFLDYVRLEVVLLQICQK